ncbi:UvrD-helicase domain-containing protein [Methanobacterium sp. MZD130B]|uniref:UvrD-helicase domain-containing protein n=1 Tax=Methanobacterium sp. MZD130B TaxID=3394378 RepID=UPI0039FCDF73
MWNVSRNNGGIILENRIFPSWDDIEKFDEPLSEGERTFVGYLDNYLPEYWKIYLRPFFNGSHPDIVLLNPEGGLMIYKIIDGSHLSSTPEANKKQLDYYRNKIIQELVPQISEKLDENSGSFVIFKTGIYVHHLESYDAQVQYEDYPYLTVVGYDDLEEDNLYMIVPGVDFQKSKFMYPEWGETLEKWLNPPFHKDKRTGIELTEQQKQHAEPKPGHKRLRGAAGSGKTLVIAYRAAELASQNQKVLVITYNRNLWYFIKEMVNNSPYNFDWSNITFRHFHGFCNDLLNEFLIPRPSNIDDIVTVLENALENKNLDKFKFDAILIDEGQDYSWEWYNFLSKFLTDRNELFLVCDEKQNIYDRELSWIDGKMENVQFRGRWAELSTIHRLPRKITDIANEFSEKFELSQSIEFDYAQTTLFNDNESFFRWENIEDDEWLFDTFDAYQTFNQQQIEIQRVRPSEIAILLPKKQMGAEVVEFFAEKGIPCDHVFVTKNSKNWRNKKISVLGDERLKISTIHQFKGWESPNVIFVIPEHWSGGDNNLDSVIYTAITRTLQNLIVLNCSQRYNEFGESLDNNIFEGKVAIESNEHVDEFEIEQWIETLPFPLASILWASFSNFNYEHKVDYLLDFFEALSEFIFTFLLSGLASNKLIIQQEVSDIFKKEEEFKGDWLEKPSFGTWNVLGHNLARLVKNLLNDRYAKNQIIKSFGKAEPELLKSLSSIELQLILKKASNYRNDWKHSTSHVSEEQYKDRFDILENLLSEVYSIIGDSFKKSDLVLPLENKTINGVNHCTVQRYMTSRAPFRQIEIESTSSMDNTKIYLANRNKKTHLEILPLIIDIENSCYFYNGKDFQTGMARYCSYHNSNEPEALLPMDHLSPFLALISGGF